MDVAKILDFLEPIRMILAFLCQRSPENKQPEDMIKDGGIRKLRIAHVELVQIFPILNLNALFHIFSDNQAAFFFARINTWLGIDEDVRLAVCV